MSQRHSIGRSTSGAEDELRGRCPGRGKAVNAAASDQYEHGDRPVGREACAYLRGSRLEEVLDVGRAYAGYARTILGLQQEALAATAIPGTGGCGSRR